MSLSPTMKMFGGGVNHEFSEAEETCILISFDEIYESKISRHVDSFLKEKLVHIKERFPLFVENMGDKLDEMLANRRARVAKRQEKRKVRRQNRKKSV
jgi:hypothetical protein